MPKKIPKIRVKFPKIKTNFSSISKKVIKSNFIQSKTFLVIAKKEFKQFFSSPLGYGILILYIIIFSFLFFGIFGYLRIQSADLGLMFTAIGYTLAVIIPALTMGIVSKEKITGTIETLLTKPVSIKDVVIGKFLSINFIILIILLLHLPIVLLTTQFVEKEIDLGIVLAQFIGAFLLGSAISSIGVACSSYFKNEITSLLSTLVISVILIAIGSGFLPNLPFQVNTFLSRISLLTNYSFITQGVLDLKSILYFLSFVLVNLILSYYFIIRNKYPSKNANLYNTRIFIIVIVVITLLIANFGQYINFKIDLTRNQLFTLSKETNQVLDKIDSILNIKLYVSNNVPVQLQPQVNTLENWLRDYQNSNSNINLSIIKEDMSQSFVERARSDGIFASGIRVTEDPATQVTAGIILGISFRYLDKTESINLLEDERNFSDFEYKITTTIYNLVRNEKPKVVLAKSDNLLKFDIVKRELSQLFVVEEIDLLSQEVLIPDDAKVLIIFAGNQNIPEENIFKIRNYFNSGGNIFFAAQGNTLFNVDSDVPNFPTKNETNLIKIFEDIGIEITKSITYDFKNFMRYPSQVNLFEFRLVDFYYGPEFILYDENSSITRNLFRLFTLWSSSLNINQDILKDKGISYQSIFKLSDESGKISPEEYLKYIQNNEKPPKLNESLITGAIFLKENGGKLVVVSDADFVDDNILLLFNQLDQIEQRSSNSVRRISNNIGFFLNSLTYLSNEIDLGNIKSKTRAFPLITDINTYSSSVVIAGIGIPVAFIISFGIYNLSKRKNLSKLNYDYENR